jgi:hypothetical protein
MPSQQTATGANKDPELDTQFKNINSKKWSMNL